MTKWYSAFRYKPKHGTQVWFWNREKHRKEIFNAFWNEKDWDASTLPTCFSPMWAYVFEGNDPIPIN